MPKRKNSKEKNASGERLREVRTIRPIWSGSLGFGLVNIPVKLFAATQEQELSFHFLHKEDLAPIRYAKVCRADGKEISFEDVVRGYEYQKGDYIVLGDEDIKKADPRRAKSVEIVEFTKETEIDPIYFERPYFLEPDDGADKAYALLREALAKTKKVGIARYVLRNKEHIGVVKPWNRVLVLDQLRFENEIRDPNALKAPEAAMATQKELAMAVELIEQLSDNFRPEEFKDTYTAELKEIIEEKAKGRTPRPRGEELIPTRVPDLMAMLRQSLEREKKKVG